VPTASEAATVEAAETSDMGDTHAVRETAAADMADTYDTVVETHAVMDDAPPAPMP
jgi:hypothetical protein